MSDTASMTVKMGLDGKPLKEGLDNAKKQGKDFAKEFESNLRETKGAVKDVSGSIEGIGRAFDGSVQGAVGGFKDLLGLLEVNPILAFGAAIAGAITGVATLAERAAEKTAKLVDDMAKIEKTARDIARKALGIDGGADIGREAEKRMGGANTSEAANAALEKQRKAVIEAEKQLNEVTRLSAENPNQGYKDWVVEVSNELTRQANIYEEMKKLAGDVGKAEQKRADEQKRTADEAEREIKARLDKYDKEQYDKIIKRGQLEKRLGEDISKVNEDAKKELQDFSKSTFSSRFSADQYTRVGGQIGGGNMRELRNSERMIELQEKHKEIAEKTRESVHKLQSDFSQAMKGLEQ